MSEGYNVILVVVDRFTKYGHFIPLKHPFTAQSVAKLFLDNVVKSHGLPRSIVSDRDRTFTSTFWKSLFSLVDTKLLMSSSYHPQTNGQTERVNQCLEMYLRCATHDSPHKWRAWLPLAELWYNSSYHSAIGCSPCKALYGHEANFGTLLPVTTDQDASAADFLKERDDQLSVLKQHLSAAQNRMKMQADSKRTDRQFAVGELVLLKLQPYVQQSVVRRPCPKLAFKFYGPYRVVEKVGSVAYKLELPEGSLIHPVFHVSQLKPFIPDHSPVFKDLPKVVELDTKQVQPEAVLDRRLVKKGNQAIPQVLVKWTNIPVEASTWEDWYVVTSRFPTAIAWGQATSGGGGRCNDW